MDIKEYIESGKLEAYALGVCSKEEAAEAEKLCKEFPELQAELDEIRKSLEQNALTHSKKPSDKVKANILSRIEIKETPSIRPEMAILYNRVRKFAVAAIALFVLSFAFNVILFKRWKETNETLTALNSEKNRLAQEFSTNQVKLHQMNTEMAVMGDPHTMKVMMKGVGSSPNSMAMIYWNKASSKVFLQIKELPMPEAGKQYQLWAIVEGKPVDAGMITLQPGDSSLHPMKDFNSAQAFAITLEKAGGSPAPTMSAMYVMGAVSL